MDAIEDKSLLVVGPGVLGSCLGKIWKDKYPKARIVGQTNTSNNHDMLQKLGFETRTKDQVDDSKFPFVCFAAPPSGSDKYGEEVAAATSHWDGSGSMVFTSSIGIYAVKDGRCTEDSPTSEPGSSERTDRILAAEKAMLDAGGNVVRLVGLYHLQRGAHTYFLKAGEIARDGESVINLIHYEDAAGITAAILEGSGSDNMYQKEIFIGADDHPMTYREMMDACVASGAFEGDVTFTGASGDSQGKGKVVDSSASKRKLGWQNKYESFSSFMSKSGGPSDFYSERSQ